MGSRVMHAIIGVEVLKRIDLENKNAFLIGCVAADATLNKTDTHYFSGDPLTFTRHVDYERFWSAQGNPESEFLLGYYCHLIADDMWMQGFFSPWLKTLIEVKPEKHDEYIQDFLRLNTLLLKEFKDAQTQIENLDPSNYSSTLKQPYPDDISKLLSELQEDIQTLFKGPLTVFSYDQISSYIKRVTDKSVYLIKQVLNPENNIPTQ